MSPEWQWFVYVLSCIAVARRLRSFFCKHTYTYIAYAYVYVYGDFRKWGELLKSSQSLDHDFSIETTIFRMELPGAVRLSGRVSSGRDLGR
jgi:hypothetical protein